jgi:hypothetical protein
LGGSAVWLLPPECGSERTGISFRKEGARTKGRSGTAGGSTLNEWEVRNRVKATKAACSPIESVCDFAVGMPAQMQFVPRHVNEWILRIDDSLWMRPAEYTVERAHGVNGFTGVTALWHSAASLHQRGDFPMNGFRNRDLQAIPYATATDSRC